MLNDKNSKINQLFGEKERLEFCVNELGNQKEVKESELCQTIKCLRQELENFKRTNETVEMEDMGDFKNVINSTTISYDEINEQNSENDENKLVESEALFYSSRKTQKES